MSLKMKAFFFFFKACVSSVFIFVMADFLLCPVMLHVCSWDKK